MGSRLHGNDGGGWLVSLRRTGEGGFQTRPTGAVTGDGFPPRIEYGAGSARERRCGGVRLIFREMTFEEALPSHGD